MQKALHIAKGAQLFSLKWLCRFLQLLATEDTLVSPASKQQLHPLLSSAIIGPLFRKKKYKSAIQSDLFFLPQGYYLLQTRQCWAHVISQFHETQFDHTKN